MSGSETIELSRTIDLLAEGLDDGLHIGVQGYVGYAGGAGADILLGDAAPGTAMAGETLALWLSGGKPLTAVAAMQQVEAGRLDLDAAVARYIPDFGQRGKGRIALRHLLTHTAGVRVADFRTPRDDWDTIIARICEAPIERGWEPGEKAGYHVQTSWYLLGELVQRAADEPLPAYLRRHVLEPAGMGASSLGMSPEQHEASADRLMVMMDTRQSPPAPAGYERREWLAQPRPGGNALGPVRELARFYEAMLAGGGGLLAPETVRMMTTRQRVSMHDHTFNHRMDWGLGFMVNSSHHGQDVPYGFGPHASDAAFGHGGNQSSIAFADPAHGLVVAIVCNGMPGEPAHQRRMRQILAAVYEDLGLATPATA